MFFDSNDFIIKYLDQSRPERTIEKCNLCDAVKNESQKKTNNGFILSPKYPTSPDAKLYVREICTLYPNISNLIDILAQFNDSTDSICTCNMLDKPSILTHWHAHIIQKQDLSQKILKYWELESEKNPKDTVTKIENELGIFYIYPFGDISINEKAKSILDIYNSLTLNENRILFTFTTKNIIFCKVKNIPNKLTVTSQLIYGSVYTRSKEKFKNIKKYGAHKILKNYSTPIKFTQNKKRIFVKQITEMLKQKQTNQYSKIWYEQMKIDSALLTSINPLVLPEKYPSDIQLQYTLKGSANVNFINIKCTFKKTLTNERTNERTMNY